MLGTVIHDSRAGAALQGGAAKLRRARCAIFPRRCRARYEYSYEDEDIIEDEPVSKRRKITIKAY